VLLDDLCTRFEELEFPLAGEREHPERNSVLAAREAVTDAVRDDEFLVDSMARELDLVERRVPRQGLVPFFTVPAHGIGLSFGYWGPGSRAGAHEHTAWTITAVCRNELEVQTYDREGSYRRRTLIPKNLFEAPAGRAGFIYEPCIHDPRNPTDRWSVSLHLYSPRDGEPVADFDEACLPMLNDLRVRRRYGRDDPYSQVLDARHRHQMIQQIAELLAGTAVTAADALLVRCARIGSPSTRQFVDALDRIPRSPVTRVRTLVRTGRGLSFGCRSLDGRVALGVETSHGWVEEVMMSTVAREALEYCCGVPSLTVDELPGRLTAEERHAIGDALELSGLFEAEVLR
jgi:hypothetical protein